MMGGEAMKNLIKTIRSQANINQKQFASALGTPAPVKTEWPLLHVSRGSVCGINVE